MKKIEAIICPAAFEAVHEALQRRDVSGLTVSEVAGFGQEPTRVSSYRGASYTIDSVPRLRLDIVASDVEAGPIAYTIAEAARTVARGDGLITIRSVDEVIRVRTGERNLAALSSAVGSAGREPAEPAPRRVASRAG